MPRRSVLPPLRLAFIALVALPPLLGCADAEEAAPLVTDASAPEGPGDPYEVVTQQEGVEPDPGPVLEGDTLVVPVAYAGGCADHSFALGYQVEGDTARLWLHHDADGDACEGWLSDEVRVLVPEEARAATMVLQSPDGGPPLPVAGSMR